MRFAKAQEGEGGWGGAHLAKRAFRRSGSSATFRCLKVLPLLPFRLSLVTGTE